MLLEADTSQVLIVDVQERLAPAMQDSDAVVRQCEKLAAAAALCLVPATLSEQYPAGIGATLDSVRKAVGVRSVCFPKMTFSCWRDEALRERIEMLALEGRRQIVVCGIESHVCVLQSALDLRVAGYDVFVVADAVSSRVAASKEIALQRMAAAGITLVTFEMIAFEWLERAGTDAFKDMLRLVK